jgi:hypothetical protein
VNLISNDDKGNDMTTETTQEAVTRYRQKSAEVEARQLIDNLRNHTAIAAWVESAGGQAGTPFAEPCLYIETPDGQKRADIGDWVVRFPAGTFQVIPGDKFDEAFEPATADELARLRNACQHMGNVIVSMSRQMECARIEMLQNGPERAMQWVLQGLPDVDDNPPEMHWNGKESADEWFERTADYARSEAAK